MRGLTHTGSTQRQSTGAFGAALQATIYRKWSPAAIYRKWSPAAIYRSLGCLGSWLDDNLPGWVSGLDRKPQAACLVALGLGLLGFPAYLRGSGRRLAAWGLIRSDPGRWSPGRPPNRLRSSKMCARFVPAMLWRCRSGFVVRLQFCNSFVAV